MWIPNLDKGIGKGLNQEATAESPFWNTHSFPRGGDMGTRWRGADRRAQYMLLPWLSVHQVRSVHLMLMPLDSQHYWPFLPSVSAELKSAE